MDVVLVVEVVLEVEVVLVSVSVVTGFDEATAVVLGAVSVDSSLDEVAAVVRRRAASPSRVIISPPARRRVRRTQHAPPWVPRSSLFTLR
ncbi:MAG TPA: hypothetical protein DCR14_01965, partial [Acidimicrobiaceae bacterium]|nr:hypothetical protein [Acidimicrobiaceae bacterium]